MMPMKVTVEKSGPCRNTLRVELPADQGEAEYERVAAAFVKASRLPGFRQGRAPRPLVERRYAREIEAETKDRLVAQTYPAALRQAGIHPVAVLDLQVVFRRGAAAQYTVVLDVPPEFKLPKYKGIPVKGRPIEVNDEAVNQALAEWLDRIARYEPAAPRPVAANDLVRVDYEGRMDGKPLASLGASVAGVAQASNFWAVVGTTTFLPGFDEGLVGLSVGEHREISVTFPAGYRVQALAGRTAQYRVHVKEIREKHLPALDADLFKQAGVESEAALRARIRADLEADMRRRETERLKEDIAQYLLAKTSLDLPESLVQEETRAMYVSLVRDTLMRGASREQLQESRKSLVEAAARSAGEKVKLGYILHRIAEEEHIDVEPAELDQAVETLSARTRMDAGALRRELEEKKELDALRHQVRMRKTLDALLAQSKPAEEGFFSRLVGR